MFAASTVTLVCGAVFVLSLDEPVTRRTNPQTQNAYVGGDITRISARVQGYLRDLPVGDNQPVRAGDVVAEIEDDDYRAERDQAQANLQAAEAQVAAIAAQQRELVAQISQSRTGEAGAVAVLARTSPELARQEILVHTDAGVRRALDQAVADQKRMQAAVSAAHAQLQVRERQAATLDAQLHEAEAAVAARRQDLVLAALNLGWTRIVAPVDGMLGARRVRVGDLLSPGTTVVSVTPLDTVWVDANFTERQMASIRVGQRAVLRLDAFPGEALDGQVVGLSPVTGGRLAAVQPDNTTGNFTKVPARVPVRIDILWRNSPLRGLLRPGMSVVATVLTGSGP